MDKYFKILEYDKVLEKLSSFFIDHNSILFNFFFEFFRNRIICINYIKHQK